MPITNLVTNFWIRSRWLISATKFGEQAEIPYSKCGRTKAPYKGMKADFERYISREIFTLIISETPIHKLAAFIVRE